MAAKHAVTEPADLNLEIEFMAEMTAAGDREIVVRLTADAPSLMGILGIMQMALRHPSVADFPAGKHFAEWARAIELRLGELGPATARICSMGWSRENDRE
jgi:hypothetical protein